MPRVAGAFVGAGRRSLTLFERSELATDAGADKARRRLPLLEGQREIKKMSAATSRSF
jgi:hypothetical protein